MATIILSTLTHIKVSNFVSSRNCWFKHSHRSVLRIPKQSNCTNGVKTDARITCSEATTTTKTVYKDNWFDRAAINYISQAYQNIIGMRVEESGYESLVVASKAVFRSFDPIQQRQIVVKVLRNVVPNLVVFLVRKVLQPSKFTRELCAAFTTVFFVWLVGPCEVRESEFKGRKEKHVVYIKKCRFLETSNCAGICTNLCKIPSQDFMKNDLGIPINMVPNFEDMSCEMIFGQDPPSLQDDPAFKQPCYKLCNLKQKHDKTCMG